MTEIFHSGYYEYVQPTTGISDDGNLITISKLYFAGIVKCLLSGRGNCMVITYELKILFS